LRFLHTSQLLFVRFLGGAALSELVSALLRDSSMGEVYDTDISMSVPGLVTQLKLIQSASDDGTLFSEYDGCSW
jgi:hypothetical protein